MSIPIPENTASRKLFGRGTEFDLPRSTREEQRRGRERERLARYDAFAQAVRDKKDWFFKILDGSRDLGNKWAREAKLPKGPTRDATIR
jgi:hypothetical protein